MKHLASFVILGCSFFACKPVSNNAETTALKSKQLQDAPAPGDNSGRQESMLDPITAKYHAFQSLKEALNKNQVINESDAEILLEPIIEAKFKTSVDKSKIKQLFDAYNKALEGSAEVIESAKLSILDFATQYAKNPTGCDSYLALLSKCRMFSTLSDCKEPNKPTHEAFDLVCR